MLSAWLMSLNVLGQGGERTELFEYFALNLDERARRFGRDPQRK